PLNPLVNEAIVRFEDPASVKVAVHLSGTELGDRVMTVAPNTAPPLATTPLPSAVGLQNTPSTPVHPFSPPSATFGPLPHGGAIHPGSAHALPLINHAVVAMMESNPRPKEPIPPAVAAAIHPSILQYDPIKAEEISRTVYVGNISNVVTDQQLMDFFSSAGPVAYVKMAGDGLQPTRFAFVEFADVTSAQAALLLNGTMLADRPLKVNHSKNAINKPPRSLGSLASAYTATAAQIAATTTE
ncbi:hypothetical protein EV182_007743, partial [Spiromyces aspiralis]